MLNAPHQPMQVGEKEAIFGSVTAAEIVDAIRMQVRCWLCNRQTGLGRHVHVVPPAERCIGLPV